MIFHGTLTAYTNLIGRSLSHMIEIYYKLIKEKKRSGELLFKFIDKPDKTVAIHTILTQIFEPDRNFFFPLIEFYTCNYFI